jgi:hypothetical protein
VHRSRSQRSKTEKETKGRAARRFRIEPNLLPLLRVMRAEASSEYVVEVPSDLAKRFRELLRRAGVTRSELFVGSKDRTRLPIRFHDLRSTGLTWMAIRGDNALVIQDRAGHSEFKTTQKYVREAQQIVCEPVFPPMPACLLQDDPEAEPAAVAAPMRLDTADDVIVEDEEVEEDDDDEADAEEWPLPTCDVRVRQIPIIGINK